MSYRFRVNEQGNIVLQVYVEGVRSRYVSYDYGEPAGSWRDATVEDIPVIDPFRSPYPEPRVIYSGSISGDPLPGHD